MAEPNSVLPLHANTTFGGLGDAHIKRNYVMWPIDTKVAWEAAMGKWLFHCCTNA